jgi:hypothetical protein
MKVGDVLKIDYRSYGCFHDTRHELVITKTDMGAILAGADLSTFWDEEGRKAIYGKRRDLLTTILDDEQLARLDRSFEYVRTFHGGGCTTMDVVSVSQVRSENIIAYEVFRDATCDLGSNKERMAFHELVRLITPELK